MVFRIGNRQWKIPERQSCMNFFIVGIVLLPIYIKLMSVLAQIMSFSTTVTTYFYYGMLWLLLLRGIPQLKHQKENVVYLIILYLIWLIVEITIHPTSKMFIFGGSLFEYIVFQPSVMFSASLFTFIGLAVSNFEELGRLLYKGARIGAVGAALTYGIMLAGGISIHYDDMSTAYGISLVLCILVAFMETKIDWIYLLIGFVCLVLAGTRGPLVCLMLTILFRFILFEKNIQKKTWGIVLCLSACIVFLSSVGTKLLMALNGVFSTMGLSNLRLLDYIDGDMLLDGSGREDYIHIIVEAIKEHPIAGYGIGGDRMLLNGAYTHNLVLEILTAMGVVVGGAFLLWLIYLWWRMLMSSNTMICRIGIGLFCGVVVKLFFSSSFVVSREFFLLLGICIAAGKENMEMIGSDKRLWGT